MLRDSSSYMHMIFFLLNPLRTQCNLPYRSRSVEITVLVAMFLSLLFDGLAFKTIIKTNIDYKNLKFFIDSYEEVACLVFMNIVCSTGNNACNEYRDRLESLKEAWILVGQNLKNHGYWIVSYTYAVADLEK